MNYSGRLLLTKDSKILLDQEDKSNLLSWMKYLLLEKQDQVFVNSNIDELHGFIAFLEKEMANQPA